MSSKPGLEHTDPKQFWEERYQAGSARSRGEPGTVLRRFAEPLTPGRALDLGCAKGDDAVWLAGKGWTVVAADLSSTALGYALDNARRSGVADRITFEQHDLARSFPEGVFDIVTASFLHTPFDWPRGAVLARGAQAITPGGHLLIIDHGSRAPWSWAGPDTQFPTAEETLATLELNESDWTRLHVGAIKRGATGPKGGTAMVLDNVIFLRRNA